MTHKQAKAVHGGLGDPSKMPGKAYGIPAALCILGSKLAQIAGTVCHGCYALKGNYRWSTVLAAQRRRMETVNKALSEPEYRRQWIDAMAWSIEHSGCKYFRWHDSGDLQSVEHLNLILDVARLTPQVRHWIPTREYAIAKAADNVPENAVVRLSAHKVDHGPPNTQLPTSTVHNGHKPIGFECGAYKRGGQCGNCRACWNPKVANVSYPKH